MVARELARRSDLGILLLGNQLPGPGTAYGTHSPSHFMNGPVRAMSGASENEQHLFQWLEAEPPHALIERVRFAAYMRDVAGEALSHENVRFQRHTIDDMRFDGEGWRLFECGEPVCRAHNVILALGNFLPGDGFLPKAVREYAGYVRNPWSFTGTQRRGDVVCVGSGLTAMDVVATLNENDFRGTIHMVSRHGLTPHVENTLALAADPAELQLDVSSPVRLLRSMRRAARRLEDAGSDWRCVAESIRKISGRIWSGWSIAQRRSFLRHLEAYWSVHRYRVPPPTYENWKNLRRCGRLKMHRGMIARAEPIDQGLCVQIASNAGVETVTAGTVVNCTGPESNWRFSDDPLAIALQARGIVRPGPLSLGIDCTPEYRVIDAGGLAHTSLFAIGSLLRGLLYETTAIPEIRGQAALLAATIVAAQDVEPVALTYS